MAAKPEEDSKMMHAEPWQTAEICGPKKAQSINKIEVVAALLKKAKHPLFVVGTFAITTKVGKGTMVDYFIDLANKTHAHVVATAQTIKAFRDKGFKEAVSINAMEITSLLTDATWEVAPKAGPHDVVVTFGFPYYMEWLMLSGLVNFAPQIRTITLGRYFQPHAAWSFPNLKLKDWQDSLGQLPTLLGGGA
jgi:acetyl-CoA decarbonylase/synthase complex subunit epsilon